MGSSHTWAFVSFFSLVVIVGALRDCHGNQSQPCVEHVAIIRAGDRFECARGHVVTTPFNGWETSITARCVCGGER